MYWFLLPLVLGFAIGGLSAFTAAFSRRFGERGGQLATVILRNVVAIPLWVAGYILAWRVPVPVSVVPAAAIRALGWVLIVVGAVPAVWGHWQLGWRTHMPSVRDTLVREGLYARVRHPIYAGGLLIFVGLVLLRPTTPVAVASAAGLVWVIVQARLEELDLLQRVPAYREYMADVPRFIPRMPRRAVR